jgi:hypothetical protein
MFLEKISLELLHVTFESFLREAGHDVEEFWMRVDDAITSIIMQNEKKILQKVMKSGVLKL